MEGGEGDSLCDVRGGLIQKYLRLGNERSPG